MPVDKSINPAGRKFRNFINLGAVPVLVVVVVFALYLVRSDHLQTSDPIWAPHVTTSLIYDGDLSLNEYEDWIVEANYYAIFKAGDRLDSLFPIGGSILAIPTSIILDAVLPQLQGTTLQEFLLTNPPSAPAVQLIQLINASLIVALSAGVIYLISREYLPPVYALVIVAIYAFGTSAYSTASRAMWQHGPSMLMVSISLLLLVKSRRKPDLIRFTALPLAAAYIMRPTNVISVVVVSLYVLLCYRKYIVQYAVLGLSLGIPFILLNLSLYGNWLPPYFAANRLQLSPTFFEALLGNLISPARGLLVFSPIFLLIPIGIAIRVLRKEWTSLDWTVLTIVFLHWLAISSFPHWWAGHSFGPRFFTDVMPYTVYLLVPILESIHSSRRISGIRLASVMAIGLLTFTSIAVHYRGATSIATSAWNNIPLNVDEFPERLWDWEDIQFLRGIGNDLITVSPTEISVAVDDVTRKQQFDFRVGLMTDGPVDILIRLPARVTLAEQSAGIFSIDSMAGGGQIGHRIEPISGQGLHQIFIEVDPANVNPGTSLAAIELTAMKRGSAGRSMLETQVISLDSWPEAPARPRDIAIHCSPGSSGELYALFGSGWYDEELVGDSSWRWASWPAYLYIWSDSEQRVTLEIIPSSLYDPVASDGSGQQGTLRVTGPDSHTTVALQSGLPAGFEVPLKTGWNTLAFELEAGYFRPADLIPGQIDARDLSFSIDGLSLSGQCAAPVAQP